MDRGLMSRKSRARVGDYATSAVPLSRPSLFGPLPKPREISEGLLSYSIPTKAPVEPEPEPQTQPQARPDIDNLGQLMLSCPPQHLQTYKTTMLSLVNYFECKGVVAPKQARYNMNFNKRLSWFPVTLSSFLPFEGVICDTVGRMYTFNTGTGTFQLLHDGKTKKESFMAENGNHLVLG